MLVFFVTITSCVIPGISITVEAFSHGRRGRDDSKKDEGVCCVLSIAQAPLIYENGEAKEA